jgi:SAM-dependent methyltransferase
MQSLDPAPDKAMKHDSTTLSSRNAVAYFDSHADYYEKNQYRTARRTFVNGRHDQIVALLGALNVPQSAKVLDAGCGPGNLLPEFASRYSRVCALDASPRMVQVARGNSRHKNVWYQVGSIEAFPFPDDYFDIVCSAGVIEYLPNCEQAIREMHRVLRPGGLLILPTTNLVAPAHWFRRLLERIARIPVVARAFGLELGTYRLWYHFIPRFKARLRAAGFELEGERHFYLTLPRPMDRLFPGTARRLESFFDRFMETPLRHFAEGYIAVARKPARAAQG